MRRRVTLTRPGDGETAERRLSGKRVPKPTDSPVYVAQKGGEEAARKRPRGEAKPRRGTVRWQLPVALSLIFAVGAANYLPYMLLVMIGLAPTWIALLTSRPAFGARAIAIAEFNLAGTLPFLARLAEQGGGIDEAVAILTDVFTWATMFGAAALGMAVVSVCPHVAVSITSFMNAVTRGDIEREQRRLIEEWGADVASGGTARRTASPER